MKIYHNPRCRKSRETLGIIEVNGKKVEIVEYLKTPPTKEEIENLLHKLNVNVKDIIRKNEVLYKEKFKNKEFTDDEWIIILTENPKLIERPIVVRGNKAVIGRPPENVLELI
ncbi:MAG: arsenate reductase (glutaredoxin) [Flavobacteriales bacterium]|nr:arsenate reductase (glutaredoxin) [Flavobacteriales bacterium]